LLATVDAYFVVGAFDTVPRTSAAFGMGFITLQVGQRALSVELRIRHHRAALELQMVTHLHFPRLTSVAAGAGLDGVESRHHVLQFGSSDYDLGL
jgi:hypothetical protein